MGVDVKVSRSSQKTQRGNQPRQTETVVAMQMGDENVIEFLKMQFHGAELELGSFAAINHKQLFPQIHDLRTQEVLGGR